MKIQCVSITSLAIMGFVAITSALDVPEVQFLGLKDLQLAQRLKSALIEAPIDCHDTEFGSWC